jgi:hypothetical protein
MTDPQREHTTEPAEGEVPGDDDPGGRTPHPQDPAEGTAEDAAAADVFGG